MNTVQPIIISDNRLMLFYSAFIHHMLYASFVAVYRAIPFVAYDMWNVESNLKAQHYYTEIFIHSFLLVSAWRGIPSASFWCIWFKYDLDKSTMHPKFNPTRVRTHDLLIMTVHFMSLRCLPLPLDHQGFDVIMQNIENGWVTEASNDIVH